MLPILHIQLVSEFRLLLGDRPLNRVVQPRLQALLAYLLLHRHAPQPRQQLAFTFWPDSTDSQAFTNLRKLYFQLRQELPHADEFLYADSQSLGWHNDAPFTLDVAELEHALEQLERSKTAGMAINEAALVEQVVGLYRRELLPTCYDDWLLPLRRSLHERVVRVLEQTLVDLEAQREYEIGLRVAEHLLRLDPLHEAAYRHLMNLRALSGNRVGALRIYHECVSVLEQELDVSPSSETQALYQWLLQAEPQTPVTKPAPAKPGEHVPLVGRKAEWQALQQAWGQATQGRPHLVILWGEAGVGKTRLVEELRHWASLRPGSVAYARAYAAEGALTYAPVTDLLRSATLRPVQSRLDPLWQTEVARLLPELLTENASLSPPVPMSEGWQRQRFYEALARMVLAAPAPLLLLLDDLQWCDGETLTWLHYLLRFDPHAPLLVVGTVRYEALDKRHPLHDLLRHLRQAEQCSEIQLAPLTAQETAVLAGHLSGKETAAWAEPLYRETEGNPLFVIEMVRAGFPAVLKTDQPVPLPQTVQAVIEARLDQLSSSARQLTQLAATMGRAFAVEVLAAAAELSEGALVQALDELWQRRIVREQGNGYDFSHDKIREVAYAELTPVRRRWLHRRIGTALTQCYAERLDEVVGELAVHAERAGQIERAIGYLRRAAQVAQVVGAYPDLVARLRKAISLLPFLPLAQADAQRQELALLVSLGAPLIALRGYSDPEVETVYRRAHELCTQLGDDPYLMPTLNGLALFYMARGDLQQAHAIGQQALLLAERAQDASLLLEGHLLMGAILLYLAQFRASRTHLEQALALYDPACHRAHADIYGQEPGVTVQAFLALCLWYMGYADRSVRVMQDALALADQTSHKYTIGLAHFFATWLHRMRRELPAVHTMATTGEALASQHGFQIWSTLGMMHRCWAVAHLNVTKGEEPVPIDNLLEQMQAAFAGYQNTGADLSSPYCLGLLAEAQAVAHNFASGLALVDDAIALMAVTKDHTCLADLQRLRGEILLALVNAKQATQEAVAEAEAAFLQAISIAQTQDARMLELRAVMSLNRLWLHQGKKVQAREELARIYSWFTEGFDTPDLLEANALLITLT